MFNKILFVTIILTLSMGLFCTKGVFGCSYYDTINLHFDNIEIDKMEYVKSDDLIVNYPKRGKCELTMTNNDLYISAKKECDIDVKLPITKKFRYNFKSVNNKDLYAIFDQNSVIIYENDIEIVSYIEDKFTIKSPEVNDFVLEVDKERMIVMEDDNVVEMGPNGIRVEGEEDKSLENFWGKILGRFIHTIIVKNIGKNPQEFTQKFINDDVKNELNLDFIDKIPFQVEK